MRVITSILDANPLFEIIMNRDTPISVIFLPLSVNHTKFSAFIFVLRLNLLFLHPNP